MAIETAQIVETFLGVQDRGILTAMLTLEGEGWGVSWGGFALDEPIKKDGKFICRSGTDWGMEFVMRTIEVAGAESWEDLKGKYVRVKQLCLGESVGAIGHIVKNKWFNPEKDLAHLKKNKQP